jgi:hypothetical protein
MQRAYSICTMHHDAPLLVDFVASITLRTTIKRIQSWSVNYTMHEGKFDVLCWGLIALVDDLSCVPASGFSTIDLLDRAHS